MRPRYRLYVDEFGDGATSAKSLAHDPYLTLVGVAFESQYYRDKFQPSLEAFKRQHLTYDPDDPPVLHKKDIIDKTGPFGVLADSGIQGRFNENLVTLIQSTQFCLICVVVDKAANIRKYGLACPDQYEYAMAGLLARYCGWLNYVVHGVGDVMAEARYKESDRDLSLAFRKIYEYGTAFYPGPQPLSASVFQKALTSKELKLKQKKQNIAGLQLADLLTYVGKAGVLEAHGVQGPKMGPYSELIRQAVQSKYNQSAFTGEVRGFGKVLIAPRK